jgi:hypothetical protein
MGFVPGCNTLNPIYVRNKQYNLKFSRVSFQLLWNLISLQKSYWNYLKSNGIGVEYNHRVKIKNILEMKASYLQQLE